MFQCSDRPVRIPLVTEACGAVRTLLPEVRAAVLEASAIGALRLADGAVDIAARLTGLSRRWRTEADLALPKLPVGKMEVASLDSGLAASMAAHPAGKGRRRTRG